jgi:DNA-binding transcriptional LysR family regulator
MDLESVRTFVTVAELGSYTRASEHLGISKARASIRVRELEEELGGALLLRTTRAVRLSEDGEQFLPRARRWLREADELSSMFQARRGVRGRVRIDLPIKIARDWVMPRVPELLADHPELELSVGSTDRFVDVVREGYDLVVRVGALPDSALLARRLGVMSVVSAASAEYVRRHGLPARLEDLDDHFLVDYATNLGGAQPSFDYLDPNGAVIARPMVSRVAVNQADAYLAACRAGLGIIQSPRRGLEPLLATGELVEVLPQHVAPALSVSLVRWSSRTRRPVRVVMDWLESAITPYLG